MSEMYMTSGKHKIEEQLVEQARQAIRKLLSDLPDVDNLTLSDMEKLTGVMGQQVMQETLQKLSETQQREEPERVLCPTCETKMQKRGKRKKRILTARGEIEVERQYYVCPVCKTGHFPPR